MFDQEIGYNQTTTNSCDNEIPTALLFSDEKMTTILFRMWRLVYHRDREVVSYGSWNCRGDY